MVTNDTPKQPGSAANQKKTERWRVSPMELNRGKRWMVKNHDDITHDVFFPEHSPDDLKEVRIELHVVLLKYVNILKQRSMCDHDMQTIHCRKGCYEIGSSSTDEAEELIDEIEKYGHYINIVDCDDDYYNPEPEVYKEVDRDKKKFKLLLQKLRNKNQQ